MLKTGILNPQLNSLLSRVRHTNTLVIADTHGFHRRLMGEAGEKRLSLHASLRGNPFAIWR